jgi:hypothetical protein
MCDRKSSNASQRTIKIMNKPQLTKLTKLFFHPIAMYENNVGHGFKAA